MITTPPARSPLPDAWRQRITAYEPALTNDEEPRIQ